MRITGWRRVATAVWGPPSDPQIYGWIDVDARGVLGLIAREREAGHHVTPTHVVGRAVGRAMAEVPQICVRLRGGHALPREESVFFITAVSGGHDLSGVKIVGVSRKSVVQVADELSARSKKLRGGEDRDFSRSKHLTDSLPIPLLRLALRGVVGVTERLGLSFPPLGLSADPFGSAMVTSVGMFGLPNGFAPLAWLYDVPLLVLVGEITEKPVVEHGQVVVRPMLPLTATIDHRYVDGFHISQLARALREYLEAPENFEPR
jgi:pyruvate/2-oxoglutarate dehydrogenase complex dihydrolipoamide acyltransferase (E2) component